MTIRDENGVVGCFDEDFCSYGYKDHRHCADCDYYKNYGASDVSLCKKCGLTIQGLRGPDEVKLQLCYSCYQKSLMAKWLKLKEKLEDWWFSRVLVVPTNDSRHYPARCDYCGWIGNSVQLGGGGYSPGCDDYDDVFCPRCESDRIDDWYNYYPWYYPFLQVRWYLFLLPLHKFRMWKHERYWRKQW